jgi:hypothetical protein
VNGFRIAIFRVARDISSGRHWEAYSLFAVGIAIVVLGIVKVVNEEVIQSVSLAALSFLVFHTSVDASGERLDLDSVLKTREDFGSFTRIVSEARTLDVYGPTAVNVLVNSADIRRFILERAGSVRVIVLDDASGAAEIAASQLDDSMDLRQNLNASLATLDRLQLQPGFSYRKLAANPGFSLVVVNRGRPDAYVIFESHGYKDENISDRMHIIIRKTESARWYTYWESRFEVMWSSARAPSEVSA